MLYNKTIASYCTGKKFIIKIFFLFYFLKRKVELFGYSPRLSRLLRDYIKRYSIDYYVQSDTIHAEYWLVLVRSEDFVAVA